MACPHDLAQIHGRSLKGQFVWGVRRFRRRAFGRRRREGRVVVAPVCIQSNRREKMPARPASLTRCEMRRISVVYNPESYIRL